MDVSVAGFLLGVGLFEKGPRASLVQQRLGPVRETKE